MDPNASAINASAGWGAPTILWVGGKLPMLRPGPYRLFVRIEGNKFISIIDCLGSI